MTAVLSNIFLNNIPGRQQDRGSQGDLSHAVFFLLLWKRKPSSRCSLSLASHIGSHTHICQRGLGTWSAQTTHPREVKMPVFPEPAAAYRIRFSLQGRRGWGKGVCHRPMEGETPEDWIRWCSGNVEYLWSPVGDLHEVSASLCLRGRSMRESREEKQASVTGEG